MLTCLVALARRSRPGSTSIPMALFALALLALLPACAMPGGGASDDADVWLLGVTGPFSQPWGQEMLLGARAAVEAVNASGGVDGRRVKLLEQDDQGDAERAIGIADEFLGNPDVLAVVGPMTSGATLGAARVYDRGLPAVATSATSPQISGVSPWVFRMIPDDRAIAAAGARFATERLNARTAAILYANDSYGRDLADAFREVLQRSGGTAIGADPYLEEMEEFSPYLLRLQQRRPDLIFVAGVPGAAERIVKQARGMGLSMPVVGGDAITALAAGERPAADVYGAVAYHPGVQTEINQEFVARFRKSHGRDPSPESAPAYDAVRLLAQTIGAGARNRSAIREALDERDSAAKAFGSVSGPLYFSERNDVAGLSPQIVRVGAGRLDLVSAGGTR